MLEFIVFGEDNLALSMEIKYVCSIPFVEIKVQIISLKIKVQI